MAPPPRRSRRLALKRITIGDLPPNVLHQILLGPSDNLLRFVAACARVCAEWRRVVGGSAAYGLGLPRGRLEEDRWVKYDGDDDERSRVLKTIAVALARPSLSLQLRSTVHSSKERRRPLFWRPFWTVAEPAPGLLVPLSGLLASRRRKQRKNGEKTSKNGRETAI